MVEYECIGVDSQRVKMNMHHKHLPIHKEYWIRCILV